MTTVKQQVIFPNEYPVYVGGVDGGNTRAKGVFFIREGEPIRVNIPSVTMTGTLQTLITNRSAGGSLSSTRVSDILSPGEYVLRRGEQREEQYIGNLALSEGYTALTGRGDERRYWNGRLLDLICTLSGSVIPDTHYNLSLVTGLPGVVYADQRNIDKVIKSLNGEHTFTLNGRTRSIYIQVIRVVQEGAAASILIKTPQPEDTTEDHALIDIGGFSTEFYVFRDMKPVSNLCKAIDIGVEQIGDIVLRQLQESYGIDAVLPPRKRYDILTAYAQELDAGKYPTIRYDRDPINPHLIANWTGFAAQRVTDRLIEFITPYWKQGNSGKITSNFASITLLGGGTHVLKRHMAKYIPRLIILEQPEMANALSYAYIAQRLHMRNQRRQSA